MDYHIFRAFADSWFLLAMTLFFAGAILFAFRPGAGATHRDSADIPFRNEDRPARSAGPAAARHTGKETRT